MGIERRLKKGRHLYLGGGSPKNSRYRLATDQEVLVTNAARLFLRKSPTRSDTGGLSGATPPKPCHGAKSIPINCPMRSYVTLIQRWRCQLSQLTH